MKEFFSWIWCFFVGGNIYPFNDENSLPVYAGSMMVSSAFAWRFFTPECAMTFSMIFMGCIVTTMICIALKSNALNAKKQKKISIIHNVILGILIICACCVKLDLAIYTFGFIAILQFIVWVADEWCIAGSIREKDGTIRPMEFKKSYLFFVSFCEFATVVIPALLIIMFISLCISLPVSIVIKIICGVAYFIIIPIMSVYSDNYGAKIPDVIGWNVEI